MDSRSATRNQLERSSACQVPTRHGKSEEGRWTGLNMWIISKEEVVTCFLPSVQRSWHGYVTFIPAAWTDPTNVQPCVARVVSIAKSKRIDLNISLHSRFTTPYALELLTAFHLPCSTMQLSAPGEILPAFVPLAHLVHIFTPQPNSLWPILRHYSVNRDDGFWRETGETEE